LDAIEYFEKNSYVIIKDILPKEVTKFIYNYFVMKGCTNQDFSTSLEQNEDISLKACYGDLNAETICSFLNPTINYYVKKDLCPTYTYSRIYLTGMDLKAHRDRPSCEYSITLNLGGDPWPIYFGERDDNSDYHYPDIQTFLHYIDKEGEHYPEHAYDGRPNLGFLKK
jgi:hypothetical protein